METSSGAEGKPPVHEKGPLDRRKMLRNVAKARRREKRQADEALADGNDDAGSRGMRAWVKNAIME
jgi:hypothetical protein